MYLISKILFQINDKGMFDAKETVNTFIKLAESSEEFDEVDKAVEICKSGRQ